MAQTQNWMVAISSRFKSVNDWWASLPDHRLRVILLVVLVLGSAIHFVRDTDAAKLNLVRQRWVTPQPDPDILVIDIDEASLAYMSQDFGRWPWPRDTLAGVLLWLEQQGAKAVLFDILFSDADQLNKAADASFADAIATSKTSYFPVLRLNPDNDKASEVKASQLKGFAAPIAANASDVTLAAVPPLFEAAVLSQRLGYHNVYPDADGVLRHYRYWEDKAGWRIWSLPARMAQDFGWGLPQQASPLTNWHRERLAHTTIPFKDVWQLSQSKAGQQPDARFKNKIVLIGATATSLFDVKTTPIATIHPGVDILATAIDNIKNHRYLLQVSPVVEFVFTLIATALMFIASAYLSPQNIKRAIVVAPTLLMGVSFATLHWGRWYLDLAALASQGFVFFGLLSTCRSLRQNYWSNPHILGQKGCTQAWAIRSKEHITAGDLLDKLLPSTVNMCLQSLHWQGRSDRMDTVLWILRVSAANKDALLCGELRIRECIEALQT